MIRRTVSAVVAAALTTALVATGSVPATAGEPISFAHTVIVDPQGLGGEPTMEVDSKGNIWISSIIGFSNHTSFLYKSEDGGESFDRIRLEVPTIQRPNATVGGGDTALIVGPPKPPSTHDTLIFIDLEGLVSFGAGATFDGGNSFQNDSVFASGSRPGGDRQWGGWWKDPQGTVHWYNFFNALADQNGGFTIIETTNWGESWVDWKRGVTLHADRSRPGPLFVDQKTGDLLLTWTIADGTAGGAGFTRCTQQKVCTDTVISKMPDVNTNNTFAAGAMDRQGNLYVVWSAIPQGDVPDNDVEFLQDLIVGGENEAANNIPTRVYMSTSTNKGQTWSKPVVVSEEYFVASMPAIAAGDAGRVDIVYYATKTKGDPNANSGPWYPVMSQSLNALAAKPTWSTATIGEHTNHINPICTAGLACTIDPEQREDRNLIDFFTVRVGPRGEALVTWNNTAHQLGVNPPRSAPITEFTKQISGPSLYADVGELTASKTKRQFSARSALVPGGAPTNWTIDEIGDSLEPRHGVGEKTRRGSLDLREAWIEPGSSPETMKVVMSINDLELFQTVSAQERNFYMMWWWADNKVHYVAADVDSAKRADCYAGAPSFSSPASVRWALYPRLSVPSPTVTTVSCTVGNTQPGLITIEVPYSAVEARAGQTLYSAHASTYHYSPPSWAVNASANLMDEIDQTAPFTYVVGSPRGVAQIAGQNMKRAPVVKGARRSNTEPLPSTGAEDAWLAIGAVLVAAAISGWRRLRRVA